MSSEIAIHVSNLSKCYHIYETPRERLKQFVLPRLGRLVGCSPRQYFREFWAIKDVSFEIKKGDTVGIIGRNGSGKSTLLQMICGTLSATSGSIQTNGRIAALLELGAGFNPEFTGRENVYMNASVLGLGKEEVDARFEDIVAFADIGDFIEQPVKTYSSGMYVRLAYSVIAHVDADILVIDEALAVGDVFFQQKCMRHLRTFQQSGGTIIFVSHDTSAVASLCNKAILISCGEIAATGQADEVCQRYVEDIYATRVPPQRLDQELGSESHNRQATSHKIGESSRSLYEGQEQPENIVNISPFRHDAEGFGRLDARILDAWFEDNGGAKLASVCGGERVNFCMRIETSENFQWPAFGFMLKDRLGQYVIAEGTDLAFRHHALSLNKGDITIVKFSFSMPILIQGEYTLNVAVAEGVGDDHIQQHWLNDALVLHSQKSRLVHGICGLHGLHMTIQINP